MTRPTNDDLAQWTAIASRAPDFKHSGGGSLGINYGGGWGYVPAGRSGAQFIVASKDIIVGLIDENLELRDALAAARRPHTNCEDAWYSCPKSSEGTPREVGPGCDCGADEHNAAIDAALAGR